MCVNSPLSTVIVLIVCLSFFDFDFLQDQTYNDGAPRKLNPQDAQGQAHSSAPSERLFWM